MANHAVEQDLNLVIQEVHPLNLNLIHYFIRIICRKIMGTLHRCQLSIFSQEDSVLLSGGQTKTFEVIQRIGGSFGGH